MQQKIHQKGDISNMKLIEILKEIKIVPYQIPVHFNSDGSIEFNIDGHDYGAMLGVQLGVEEDELKDCYFFSFSKKRGEDAKNTLIDYLNKNKIPIQLLRENEFNNGINYFIMVKDYYFKNKYK
jgi:diacylglycerol kinase family enzyme